MSKIPKVSVYMPNYNYFKFIDQAIKSVIRQNFNDWELLIIQDGNIDFSEKIIKKYNKNYPNKIKIYRNKTRKGLQYCANLALKKSRGKYIIRLDPDDYLDESALLLMSSLLDKKKSVNLIYPDFFYVDKNSNILDLEKRKKIGIEDNALDLPAHGACTMIRKNILIKLGGYNEKFKAQDGYDIWYKFSDKKNFYNISTPLFFYRQHNLSITKNESKILRERKRIKDFHFKRKDKDHKILFIIGAKKDTENLKNVLFKKIKNKFLIDYTIDQLKKLKTKHKIIVNTDNKRTISYIKKLKNKNFIPIMRNKKLIKTENLKLEPIINESILYSKENNDFNPDIAVYLNSNAPLKSIKEIMEGVHTLILHNFDKVISVYEDFDLHYIHSKNGLEALAKRQHSELRIEREALFVDNRAFSFYRTKLLGKKTNILKSKVGHVVMPRNSSYNIRTKDDLMLIKQLLK